jgi:hypothetical protein
MPERSFGQVPSGQRDHVLRPCRSDGVDELLHAGQPPRRRLARVRARRPLCGHAPAEPAGPRISSGGVGGRDVGFVVWLEDDSRVVLERVGYRRPVGGRGVLVCHRLLGVGDLGSAGIHVQVEDDVVVVRGQQVYVADQRFAVVAAAGGRGHAVDARPAVLTDSRPVFTCHACNAASAAGSAGP